jgi:2,3-bisphosphoglycerate-dependent phosphoglycerate mutase
MSTQILLIRHGETDWNRIKRIQGHIDMPLATTGLAQAEQLAQRLARESEQGAQLHAVYSSDLLRARQTAQPFADALGLPVQLRRDLRERRYGAFQGHDNAEISEQFPSEYAHWQTRDPDFVPPGGESLRSLSERTLHALSEIANAHPGGRIACVAHGGVLDCVYRSAMQVPLEMPRNWLLLNCSINVVNVTYGAVNIVKWADVTHLAEASSDDDLKKPR